MTDNILKYIDQNYNNNSEIQSEIDILFNNLLDNIDTNCSIIDTNDNNIVLNGADDITPSLSDLTKLIPNLFRKCFYNKDGIDIPNVCPKLIYLGNNTFYYPIIINKNILKSFLYYNFPSNIYNYTPKEGLLYLAKNKKIIYEKKLKETYSSTTTPQKLFAILYNNNSMLIQLLIFNNYLNMSDYKTNNNQIIGPSKIIWDFISYCICYTKNISDTYIINNNVNNTYITEAIAANTYYIQYGLTGDLINNILNIDTIFTVLKYSCEVYNDILLELQYFMANTEYCQKPYMSNRNIPKLLKLYDIYYNNQIYAYSKNLESNLSNNIQPSVISINTYTTEFITIYLDTYPHSYILRTVYLTSNSSLVFIVNDKNNIIIDENIYSYYYINIFNPSANNVLNSWIYNIDYTTTGIQTFINDFINGVFLIWEGYLLYSKSSSYDYKIYVNGGVYPESYNGNPLNVGYLYNFYNLDKSFNSRVYLTLEQTIITKGVALKFTF